MTTIFLVVAGNIIDGYNEDVPNTIEVFTTQKAADQFGELYDFYTVTEKILDPAMPSVQF